MCPSANQDPQTSAPKFVASGTVRYTNGVPAAGLIVALYDRDLRRERKLGEALTDAAGGWSVTYAASRPLKRERGGPNLVLRALDASGDVVAFSEPRFDAGDNAVINLVISSAEGQFPSLFDRLSGTLAPLLGDVDPASLEENSKYRDLTYLASASGLERSELTRFAVAHRFSVKFGRAKKLGVEFWFALLGEELLAYDETQSLDVTEERALGLLPSINEAAARKALRRSLAENAVASSFGDRIEREIGAFDRLAGELSLGSEVEPTFLGSVLRDARVADEEKRLKFARLLRKLGPLNASTAKAFRSTLEPAQMDAVATSLRLGELTDGKFALVKALKNQFRLKRPADIRRLAAASEEDWIEFANRNPKVIYSRPPRDLPAPPVTEMAAANLARVFRDAYPTATFGGALDRALGRGEDLALRHGRQLSKIIAKHPDFDLRNCSIDAFLDGEAAATLGSAATNPDLRTELKAVQRLTRFAPNFSTANALLADGIHSAQGAYRLGASEYVRRYSRAGGLSEAEANAAWNRAADTAAATLTVVGELTALDPSRLPATLAAGEPGALARFPNWENLFRSGDLCECEHCRSVLGPAAYFADLLMFLRSRRKNAGADPDGSVASLLHERRPELGFLELNCANALTPLPYVDIVCEVLEAAIAGEESDVELAGFTAMPSDPSSAHSQAAAALEAAELDPGSKFTLSQVDVADPERWVIHGDRAAFLLKKKSQSPNFFAKLLPNTKADAEALRSYPAHVIGSAYNKLKQARFPHHLPFDLHAEEVEAAFEKMKVERSDLMRVFRPSANASEGETAAVDLGIRCGAGNVVEKALITVAEPSHGMQQSIWGEEGVADWLTSIAVAEIFLDKTGLEHHELLALLELEFINPSESIILRDEGGCDLAEMQIEGLDAGALDRIHRFLRLWRKLRGWATWELDLAVRNPGVGNGRIDDACLVQLCRLEQLKARLGGGLGVEELCALFADLNTESRFVGPQGPRGEGLYQRLFLEARRIQPLDPAFALAAVTSSSNEDIMAHSSAVLAALKVKPQELEALLGLEDANGDPLIGAELTLANLSALWRHILLFKQLDLSVADWGATLKLLGEDLRVFSNAAEACKFVERVDGLLGGGLKALQASWILLAGPTSPAAKPDAESAKVLKGLWDDLAAIAKDRTQLLARSEAASDPAQLDPLLMETLQRVGREEADARFTIDCLVGEARQERQVDGLPSGFVFPQAITDAVRIGYDETSETLHLTGVITAAQKVDLLAVPGTSGNASYALAIEEFHGAAEQELNGLQLTLPLHEHRIENLKSAIAANLELLHAKRTEEAVVRQLSGHLKLSRELTAKLVTEYSVLASDPLLDHFTGPFLKETAEFDRSSRPDSFGGLDWADRVARLWAHWRVDAENLDRIARIRSAGGLPDFELLPMQFGDPPIPIEAFVRLDRLLRFDALHMRGDRPFLQLLVDWADGAFASVAELSEAIAEAQGSWPSATIEAMLAKVDPTSSQDFLQPQTWECLARAFELAGKLGASVEEAASFGAAEMGDTHARSIRQLLRAKLGEPAWKQFRVELQDGLRERKRDALTSYLLAQPAPAHAPSRKWNGRNDLYAYFLIDVEMGACQLTSRLVQAANSVQLFVQRCFMDLEPEVRVVADGPEGDSAWRWWTWIRKYRWWEANVKVFLWPENWIEPELRRDRSETFRRLEADLLQGEIDEASVNAAFANYLEGLHKVGQLDVVALHQEDDGDDTTVHVFGRTPGTEPHELFYRTFDFRKWSPWAKVERDIPGEYLTPLVLNGRPLLFWPVFAETNDEGGNSRAPLPTAGSTSAEVPKASKRLGVRMAVSYCRNGEWSAPKLSKDYVQSHQPHAGDIQHRNYRFFVHDRGSIDGRLYLRFDGGSITREGWPAAELAGAFDIAGCAGAPERATVSGQWFTMSRPEVYSTSASPNLGRWRELGGEREFVNLIARIDAPENDFTLENAWSVGNAKYTLVLANTPGLFRVTPGWHLSYMDKVTQDGLHALAHAMGRTNEPFPLGVGSWLPFFYADRDRTFFVAPAMQSVAIDRGMSPVPLYYPDLKSGLRAREEQLHAQISAFVGSLDLGAMGQAIRSTVEASLFAQAPGETLPPFTDEDLRRRLTAALMRHARLELTGTSMQFLHSIRYHFQNFYHPFICDFAKLVHDPRQGVPSLMTREIQFKKTAFHFAGFYRPSSAVIDSSIVDPSAAEWRTTPGYPEETVDFSPRGAYSSYNWELFFHVPLLIANALSRNQRFEEARNWYHFIFNPLGLEGPAPAASPVSRYWITKPFYQTSDPTYLEQRIEDLLRMVSGEAGASQQAREALLDQVKDWRLNPYEPHRIAGYRTVAYQKNVVMKYLDNLLAWGDQLFRQDSMESIAEATQLYILAAEILGPRPRKIERQAISPQESFFELENQLDAMSNALVEVENLVPGSMSGGASGNYDAPLPSLYFCIPRNDRLLGYWDRVADRLFKIRHCQNIDGVVRRLAMFELPIDSLLVKAVAAGIDVSTAMAEAGAPIPPYRFAVMLQKANEVCNDVKALGSALLAALEKQDAEELALLRQAHELRAIRSLIDVREFQVEEAKEALQSLVQARAGAEARHAFYRDIDKISGWEHASRLSHLAGIASEIAATVANTTAAAARVVPQYLVGGAGLGGSPVVVVMTGGEQVAEASTNWAGMLSGLASVSHSFANLSGDQASYERRWDEWKLQEKLAQTELNQLDRQIVGAEIRLAMAEKERDNLVLQIDDAEELEEFMVSKYTNEELYQWHIGQISGTYFATYRLAHDLAKRAERCFRFELGLQDSDFIAPGGYWDSLKKGLLSGEKLQFDLRRLEAAYLERHRRAFELTKHVSLAQLSPFALIELKETGRCRLSLPEEIFDLDYPGHYFRAIESVSMTIPAVAGPYTTIGCTLRLLRNETRVSPDVSSGYRRPTDEDGTPLNDPRFVEASVPVSSIAISSGQNDSGMFEFSFRDERYLPFEGAGAVSEWAIELFFDPDPNSPDFGRSLRQFDYSTIGDVILHVKYTAREDAGEFKQAAIANLREELGRSDPPASWLALDLRRQFATQWSRFVHPTDPANGHHLEFALSSDHFRSRDAGLRLGLVSLAIVGRSGQAGDVEVSIAIGEEPAAPLSLTENSILGGLLFGSLDVSASGFEISPDTPSIALQIDWTPSGGSEFPFDDLLLVIGYHRPN